MEMKNKTGVLIYKSHMVSALFKRMDFIYQTAQVLLHINAMSNETGNC